MVRLDVGAGVARLVLDRRADANALDLDSARDALGALRTAESDPSVLVLAITGAGDFFCGGGDVKGMAAADDPSAFLTELADAVHEFVFALVTSRLFVVAAVNGPAAGGGLGLVLAADYVIASERARFLGAYAAIGLTPDSGVSYLLARAVGHRRAMELLLTGRRLSAPDALQWGLLNESVTPEDFDSRVSALCESIAAGVPEVLAETKKLMGQEHLEEYRAHLAQESATIARMAAHPQSAALIRRFASRNSGASPA
ncbi:enoyl-CoA hydratase/isomerase family protein [Parafrigoribacterium mesophilum]|uniref:enoyl-CoA hydratase/isomerase family protein n=1 Tax=Parafrigoribacterium mesophilum TaxID=433646 RepID=UPI0031FD1843